MKRDKWTQQLHDKLAEHEMPAPADLWADIEAALPQQPLRSRFVALRRWAVAASVALLLGGGAMVWWEKQTLQTIPQQTLQTLPQPLPAGRGVVSSAADTQGAATPLPSRGGAGGGVSNFSQSVIAQAEMPVKTERTGKTEGTEMPIETEKTGKTEKAEKTVGTEKSQTPPPNPSP